MMNGKIEEEESAKPVEARADDEVVELGQRKTAGEMLNDVVNFCRQAIGFTVSTKNRVTGSDLERALELVKDFSGQNSMLFTVKGSDNNYRWVSISSSFFKDRDGEIVPEKALIKDVLSNPTDRGKLLFWHEPSLELGDCDFASVFDGFLVESGYWYNNDLGVAARKSVAEMSSYYGISIGFQAYVPDMEEKQVVGDQDVKTVYNTIRTKERSLLPAKYASNLFTAIQTKGNEIMDPLKVAEFENLVGKDLAGAVMRQIESKKEEAQITGAVSKEVSKDSPLDVMVKSLEAAGYTNEAEALKASQKKMTPEEEAAAEEEDDKKKKLPPQFAKKEQETVEEDKGVATLAALLADLVSKQADLIGEVQTLKNDQSTRQGVLRPSQDASTLTKEVDIPVPVKKSAGELVLDDMTQAVLNRIGGGV